MSQDGIEQLAGLFTLPEVSASADTILAREHAKNNEQNNDDETTQNTGPKVSPGAAEKLAANKEYGEFGKSDDDKERGNSDDHGAAFDPAIHATDAEGRPKKTKAGKWAKKRGRKTNATGYTQTTTSKTSADIEAEQAGLATAQILFTMGVSIGGEEWQPVIDESTGRNEPLQMSQAWAEYYKSAGVTNIPPWLTVVIACSVYALPRLTMPQTQTRLQRLRGWIGQKLDARKRAKNSD